MIGTVEKVYENKTRTGKTYWAIQFAGGEKFTCWDNAVVQVCREGASVEYEIQENKGFKNLVKATAKANPAQVAGAGPAAGTSERDTLIVRQVAVKAAVELVTGVPHSFGAEDIPAALDMVLRVARQFEGWVLRDAMDEAMEQAAPPQPVSARSIPTWIPKPVVEASAAVRRPQAAAGKPPKPDALKDATRAAIFARARETGSASEDATKQWLYTTFSVGSVTELAEEQGKRALDLLAGGEPFAFPADELELAARCDELGRDLGEGDLGQVEIARRARVAAEKGGNRHSPLDILKKWVSKLEEKKAAATVDPVVDDSVPF